jgi:putative flavoprotein involved in K+ transport
MAERIETVVVGGGQAGLSVSHFLSAAGREHVVLERGDVAHTWRTRRWDGFYLNTPKWTQHLPGYEYAGPEPDAFSSLDETIAYLVGYAEAIRAPVRTGVSVTGLRPREGGLDVETDYGVVHAANVVVATGAYHEPTPTALAEAVPDDVLQLHTSAYRNPEQLPQGAVLVVGAGQSGCQIADELLQDGRRIYLSVGRCPWIPRRYRDREIVHWLVDIGFVDQTVDSLPSPAARLACNAPVSGNDGGHDCNPLWLEERGASLLGRLRAVDGRRIAVAPDLEKSLAFGAEKLADLMRQIEEHVAANGLEAPDPEPAPELPARPAPIEELDLLDAGVSTILWSNGYRPSFGWIDAPLFDDHGWPAQVRGVTELPGLYFVGLHWLHTRRSSLLFGVGADAEHVVSHLVARGR